MAIVGPGAGKTWVRAVNNNPLKIHAEREITIVHDGCEATILDQHRFQKITIFPHCMFLFAPDNHYLIYFQIPPHDLKNILLQSIYANITT